MVKRPWHPVILLASLFIAGTGVAEETPADPGVAPPTPEERRAHREAMRERWQNMSEEEREVFRQEMREKHGGKPHGPRRHFRHLSEEERAAMRERWQNMSEEEREAFRQQMRERHSGQDRKHRPREPQA